MPWYKRLRWRLIASQFLVAFVGVAIMMLATRIVILSMGPALIRPYLVALLDSRQTIPETELALIYIFRNAVLVSVAVAAVGAIAAGVLSSFVIWRTLIAPLRQMAVSSRRIADGRYNERVGVPDNSGEAMAQLVVNFNEMAEALERVEQQRVALLGNISHELRTPLTGLKGYLEGLLDGLFVDREETYDFMLHEIDRLNRLVTDIQKLSQMEAGQISLNMQAFDVAGVARRVCAQMLHLAQAQSIALAVKGAETAVTVYADPDRTAQVMINLVSNALRYTPEQGHITIHVKQNRNEANIAVEDSGIGIPAEALPYLFERFYRVDNSRARASGGSGIGLTIARHLVWAMGGDITVASEGANEGSTFTFTLPLHLA